LEQAAGEGFSTATGIADRLAMSGLPFRTAHEIVATTAQTLESAGELDDGAPDDAATIEALAAATEATTGSKLETYVDREELTALLDPAESVAARDSRGGPAPSQVEQALADARSGVEADRRAVTKRQAAIDAAEQARMEVDFR
ncbi:MAG: argininosuccinate lyase, partial [Halobacteriota archaeon]